MSQTRSSSRSSSASGRPASKRGGRFVSSRATGPPRRTELLVVHGTPNISTVVQLTLSPADARRLKRTIVALLAWALTATAGLSTSTLVQALH